MRPNHLLYIDSLRGWAILLVIACHQALEFRGLPSPVALLASYGQTGVFLFFVVSAYTLCNSALQRADEAHATRNFFIRRYFRIAPLYYVGMACYLLLQWQLPAETALFLGKQSTANIAANTVLMHGLLPTAFTGVVPGGWSIGTEWLFYLLFPALFAACLQLQERFGWTVLLVPLVMMAAVSAVKLAQQDMNNSIYWFWYDSILNQLPVFMCGIALFFAVRAGRFQPAPRRDAVGFLLLAALGLWLLKHSLFIALPLASTLSFVFFFNLLRVTSRSPGWIARLGRVSYSMYVFHFVFVVLAAKLVLALLPVEVMGTTLAFAASLALSIHATYLLASLTEQVIERRFIAYGSRLAKH